MAAEPLAAVEPGAPEPGAPEPARSRWWESQGPVFHCRLLEYPDSQVFPAYAVSATVKSWW
jgi:hypothetical protein